MLDDVSNFHFMIWLYTMKFCVMLDVNLYLHRFFGSYELRMSHTILSMGFISHEDDVCMALSIGYQFSERWY